MIHINTIQGSEEWFHARLGIPTASCFGKIVDSKGNLRKGQMPETYAAQLLKERLLGQQLEWPGNQWTERGNLLESQARAWYALETMADIQEHGFCLTDDRRIGYSPDALVDDDGLLEIKCPREETHICYLLSRVIPPDYYAQCQGGLLVTGRGWIDFVSFHPDLPKFCKRVVRGEYTENLRKSLDKFCDDLDQKEALIKSY